MKPTHRPLRGPVARPLALTIAALCVAPAVFAQNAEQPVRMSDIVISASGFEQEIKQAPASITVVTREQLERRQVSSLAEALEGIEGVNVRGLDSRDGKTGNQSISLRGLPREYTLILIDGVRQNPMGTITPNSLNDALSAFIPPVAAIERIEIIRGPMATLYGSDALGGVVNVITRRAGDTWSGAGSISRTFQGDSDFGDKETIDAYIAGPLADRLSLQLYGRQFDRQRSNVSIPGVTTPRAPGTDTPTMGQSPSSAMIRTIGGKLSLDINPQHELSLAFNVTEQTYDNKRGDIRAIDRRSGTASACNSVPVGTPNFCRGYADTLEINREQVTLGYQGRFDLGLLETKLTRDYLESKGRTIPLDNNTPLNIQGSKRTLELETWILDTRFIAPIGERNLLTVGGQYIRPEMTDGLWLGEKNSMRQYSVFAENEWRVTDSLALTGGLRYDNNEYFSGQLSPRVYAVWDATDRWTFKGGVGRGFRTPYIEQMSSGIIGYGNQGTRPLYGNPNLKPEISTNYEVSALYSDNRMTAQATVFRQDLKDLIESGTGANSGTMNIGEARVQGVELGASYALTRDLRLSGNYTFIDSKVIKTQLDTGSPAQHIASRKGDPLVSVPDHMFNATLTWQATPKLETFLSAEYRSSAFRPRNYHEPHAGGDSQGQVTPGVRDSRTVLGDFKGYTQFNLGASYRVGNGVTLHGAIQNLFNKDFKDYKQYNTCTDGGCVTTGTGYSNVYNTILEPRRLYVSLNVEF